MNKKVAKCVLADPANVIDSSITELAEKSETSEPTVIRFCRKLGPSGYMELPLNLARDLPSSQHIFENVTVSDSMAEIAGKIMNAHCDALNNTLNKLNLDEFSAAAGVLCKAARIEFYGVGGSAIVARDAHHKFFRLGIPSMIYDDPHMQVMSAAQLTANDVVVAVSRTGSTKDIIDNVTIARNSGAKIIGILGSRHAPLVKLCDIALSAFSREAAVRLAPTTSRPVQLAIIDVLFVAVAMNDFWSKRFLKAESRSQKSP